MDSPESADERTEQILIEATEKVAKGVGREFISTGPEGSREVAYRNVQDENGLDNPFARNNVTLVHNSQVEQDVPDTLAFHRNTVLASKSH